MFQQDWLSDYRMTIVIIFLTTSWQNKTHFYWCHRHCTTYSITIATDSLHREEEEKKTSNDVYKELRSTWTFRCLITRLRPFSADLLCRWREKWKSVLERCFRWSRRTDQSNSSREMCTDFVLGWTFRKKQDKIMPSRISIWLADEEHRGSIWLPKQITVVCFSSESVELRRTNVFTFSIWDGTWSRAFSISRGSEILPTSIENMSSSHSSTTDHRLFLCGTDMWLHAAFSGDRRRCYSYAQWQWCADHCDGLRSGRSTLWLGVTERTCCFLLRFQNESQVKILLGNLSHFRSTRRRHRLSL